MQILKRIFGTPRQSALKGKQRENNPAFNFVMGAPKGPVTQTLLAGFRDICDAVSTNANEASKTIGLTDPLFIDCIIDLMLLGGFDTVSNFTRDKPLASAFVDAIVFELTGKDPSKLPRETEFLQTGTVRYRGILKYVMAPNYFKVSGPEAYLFGKEYSQIRTGSSLDIAEIARGSSAAYAIMKSGRDIFDHFLVRQGRPRST